MEKKSSKKAYVSKAAPFSRDGRIDLARRRSGTPFPYDELDEGELCHFVTRVLKSGNMLSLTATSDGGALSITITINGTRYRTFAADGNEFLTATTDLCDEVL